MAISDELRKLVDRNNECCCEHCLSNKCKEWAYNKGYEIVSLANMIRIYKNGYEVYYTNSTLFDLDMFFKACQWILDNTEDI